MQREEAAPLTQQLVHLGVLRRGRHEHRTHLLRVGGGGEREGDGEGQHKNRTHATAVHD